MQQQTGHAIKVPLWFSAFSRVSRLLSWVVKRGSAMTILRGFLVIGLSALVCGAVGAGIGSALGVLAPDYYRGVFPQGNPADFHPVQLGLALGLTQGLVCGLLVGCVVVLAVAWYNSRRESLRRGEGPDAAPPPPEPVFGGSQAIRPARRPGE